MNTTFLLHSGGLKKDDPRNDAYFAAIAEGLSDGDTVLFIGFARRDEGERQHTYERDMRLLLAQTEKDVHVVNATHEDLIEQVREAKAIMIAGGETNLLVADIQKYPEFPDAIRGKVVAGSSAGACLFSTYYYYCQKDGVLEGLDYIPMRFMCHYDNPDYTTLPEARELMDTYAPELELITLDECDWIEREVEDF